MTLLLLLNCIVPSCNKISVLMWSDIWYKWLSLLSCCANSASFDRIACILAISLGFYSHRNAIKSKSHSNITSRTHRQYCLHRIRKQKTTIVIMHWDSFLWRSIFFTKCKWMCNVVFLFIFEKLLISHHYAYDALKCFFAGFFGVFSAFVKSFKNNSQKNVVKTARIIWKFLIVLLSASD